MVYSKVHNFSPSRGSAFSSPSVLWFQYANIECFFVNVQRLYVFFPKFFYDCLKLLLGISRITSDVADKT